MREKVIAVDDQPDNLLVLEHYLGGDYDLTTFSRGQDLLDYFATGGQADLILLDIMMPMLDGYSICRWLKANAATRDVPVVFLTSLEGPADEAFALSLGAEDFIHKPLSPPVVLARVRNHLLLSSARQALLQQNQTLETLVAERTRKIQEQADELAQRSEQIIAAQGATITAFCALVETRDNETGNHIRRTQHYMLALCEQLREHPKFAAEMTVANIRALFKSAPMHDVGKVAIPDNILHKPGKLTPDEWAIMQRHAELGANAIAMAQNEIGKEHSAFLEYARQIAHAHHERWDGTGYPRQLAGEDIPLAGRLMAIADVYDALISRRVYKPAFSHDAAVAIMRDGRGRHFDPDLLDVMLAIAPRFDAIAKHFCDPDESDQSDGCGDDAG